MIKYPEEIRQDWWEYILRKYMHEIKRQQVKDVKRKGKEVQEQEEACEL